MSRKDIPEKFKDYLMISVFILIAGFPVE